MEPKPKVDAFKDQLEKTALDSGVAALANQCRGRELDANEDALAEALMLIFADGIADFSIVASELSARNIVAPRSKRTDWSQELLAQELAALNAELDNEYETNGYGA